MKPTMFQHLKCTNDTNGNPRRIYAFYAADGRIVAVEDEGYRGAPKQCRDLVQLPTLSIQPSERRDMLRDFPRLP